MVQIIKGSFYGMYSSISCIVLQCVGVSKAQLSVDL